MRYDKCLKCGERLLIPYYFPTEKLASARVVCPCGQQHRIVRDVRDYLEKTDD